MTQPVNALPLNFPDVSSEFDLDPYGAEIASDLEGLEADVIHMLLESPGSNIDDPTRGAGLGQLLSGPDVNLGIAAQSIDRALEQDDRVDSSSTVITKTGAGAYALQLTVNVSGSVLSLSYAYTATGGLQAT